MKDPTPIAVCSRTFSRDRSLRAALLGTYSDVRFNDAGVSLRGRELVEFLQGRHKVIVGLEPLDDTTLAQLPELQVVSKFGVGLDKLDLTAMASRGVRLGWTGGVNRRAVAELVISFAIDLLRGLHASGQQLRRGEWSRIRGRELGSVTFGLVGCGNIGKEVVRLLQPFGCRILVHDLLHFEDFYAAHNVTPATLKDLLRSSDVVSLHLPLDDSTRRMLDAEHLGLLRAEACLINTARGGLIDEKHLYQRLRSGLLRAAAFDVFEEEPPFDNPLLKLENFVCSAHIAGSSEQATDAMGQAAIRGLLDHRPAESFLP
ncbi:MAG: phosphoglycerate dehydrogenase-like enzyme [Myxococcota bacterium]|jgi:phosphoglycerate dehydrogenase-like enzyme